MPVPRRTKGNGLILQYKSVRSESRCRTFCSSTRDCLSEFVQSLRLVICGNMLLLWLLVFSLSAFEGSSRIAFDISGCPLVAFGSRAKKIKINPLMRLFDSVPLTDSDAEVLIAAGVSKSALTPFFSVAFNVTLPKKLLRQLHKYLVYNSVDCNFALSFLSTQNRPEVVMYFVKMEHFSVVVLDAGIVDRCHLKVEMDPFDPLYGSPHLPKDRFFRDITCAKTEYSILDLSGCFKKRNKGVINKVSVGKLVEKCENFKGCNSDNSLVLEKMCENKCDDKGRCLKSDLSCSVFASSVIDAKKKVLSVEDYCSYTLLSTGRRELLGNFNFYRDTGTPFLDSLDLKLETNTTVHFKGPRVYVNDVRVNLGSSEQDFKDFKMFIDKNGVNLKATLEDGPFSIVYNEMIAHIKAPDNEKNLGLCAGRQKSAVKENRHMDKSDPSCRQDFDNKPQKRTDCPKEEKLCKVFAKDSQMAKVCTGLLCEYGNKDDLLCNLETVYRLRTGQNRTGLNLTDKDCACRSFSCADHEFCAVKDGEPECHCHAPFLYQFTKSGRYGEETTCENDTASVQLPLCLVTYRGFEESQLHLLDKECKGQLDDVTHMINFKFDHTKTCGAKIWNNDSHIIYTNTVTSSDEENADITREYNVQVNFSCSAKHPKSRIMFINIEDNSMNYEFLRGQFLLILKQKLCTEYKCHVPVKPREKLRLGKEMFVFMDLHKKDNTAVPGLALVIESCVASIHPKGKAKRQHKLITNGCADPGDKTVRVMENGDSETAIFCVKVFTFKGFHEKVTVNCKVRLCLKKDGNCHPKCGKKGTRHRRSVAGVGTEIVTSMSWTYQGSDD